jgi:hypothetical protein
LRYEIEFEVPGRSPSGNVVSRLHWSKRRKWTIKVAWEIQVAMNQAGIAKPLRPLPRARIEIISVRSRLLDVDRLYGGLTAYVDALQPPSITTKGCGPGGWKPRSKPGLSIIASDSPDCIDYVARQRVGFPERVIIRVEELQ